MKPLKTCTYLKWTYFCSAVFTVVAIVILFVIVHEDENWKNLRNIIDAFYLPSTNSTINAAVGIESSLWDTNIQTPLEIVDEQYISSGNDDVIVKDKRFVEFIERYMYFRAKYGQTSDNKKKNFKRHKGSAPESNLLYAGSKQSRNRKDEAFRIQVHVDLSEDVSPLTHFWKSSGFCPPDPHKKCCEWLLSPDMTSNLAYIGAVPQGGIVNIRVHYLLDAITITRIQDGGPLYNFSCLDAFIKNLHQNGLKPGFEIMGNPSQFFTDMENNTQVFLWKDLVYQLATRYINEYGLGYVADWNFESWNEPKIKSFDGFNFTFQGFLNYYDACSEGLKQASSLLKLGAPSGGCKEDYSAERYCWVLLDHLNSGKNYFTGERNVRVDFISIHKKGLPPNNAAVILARELHFYDLLSEHFPHLLGIPLINDEADPLVTWSKALTWRADTTYSGIISKVITEHQFAFFTNSSSKIKYQLLSNDNGFLSYQPHPFSQRTLLARFQVNNTDPHHVQFIRKPSHSVMGLLSLLGDIQVQSFISEKDLNGTVGVLASAHKPSGISPQDSWQMAALVYYSTDTLPNRKRVQLFPSIIHTKLTFQNFPSVPNVTKDMKYVVYILDQNHGNPYQVWIDAGSPRTPNHTVFRLMRLNEDPVRLVGPSDLTLSDREEFVVPLNVSLPSVILIHACTKAVRPPDQVTELMLYSITCNQVLVVWRDSCINTKCILRYEVEFSSSGATGSFRRVNPLESIFTIVVHAPVSSDQGCTTVHGFYRVRAVDYWDRPGEYSLVVQYT